MPAGGKIGNKGGGRKSAYRELADAKALLELFFKQYNREEMKAAIASGKFSIRERLILTAMDGDPRALTSIFNKVFPDKMELGNSKDEQFLISFDSPPKKSE